MEEVQFISAPFDWKHFFFAEFFHTHGADEINDLRGLATIQAFKGSQGNDV